MRFQGTRLRVFTGFGFKTNWFKNWVSGGRIYGVGFKWEGLQNLVGNLPYCSILDAGSVSLDLHSGHSGSETGSKHCILGYHHNERRPRQRRFL